MIYYATNLNKVIELYNIEKINYIHLKKSINYISFFIIFLNFVIKKFFLF